MSPFGQVRLPFDESTQLVLVCHCAAVNDGRIREAIAAGARDEFDVAEACGAGTVCGGCLPAVMRLLGECVGCPLNPERGPGSRRPEAAAPQRAGAIG